MSTESTPTAKASSIDTPKRMVADKYRDTEAALKIARRNLFSWIALLTVSILNFAGRVAIHVTDEVNSGRHSQWDSLWLVVAIILVPAVIWQYSIRLAGYTRTADRKSLAESALLKEATKPATDK
jgi:putative copper export protein